MQNSGETMSSRDLETEVQKLGTEVFSKISDNLPSAFDSKRWQAKILDWAMSDPEFKVNSFRLVDVLPSLRTSSQIAAHVREYLAPILSRKSRILGWATDVPSRSLRGAITASIVRASVKKMASQFIAGNHPQDSLKTLKKIRSAGLCFTVDLLGEFSVSEVEAENYLKRYIDALDAFANDPYLKAESPILKNHPGEKSSICISVKLSALYSQTSVLNWKHSVQVLSNRLEQIALRAKKYKSLLYVDAEDSANNTIIYEVFKRVFSSKEFQDFHYPGIVVQSYAKGAQAVLEDLKEFSKKRQSPIAIRLVKGAYWDHETALSAQNNWESPLFSRKESSDANFELLSRYLIDNVAYFMPAFGSHNVRSLAQACCYAKQSGLNPDQFELQMLHGMAEPIANAFKDLGYLVRLYVPLGELIPGMGYLVRRLLENTSNESFLRSAFHDHKDLDKLLRKPVLTE